MLFALVTLVGCRKQDACQPLDDLPIEDLSADPQDTGPLQDAFTRFATWFQTQPCVSRVQLVDQVSADYPFYNGQYDDASRSILLEPSWDGAVVRHELCHAADNSLGWLSLEHAADFDGIELTGCPACDDLSMRLIETFAARCEEGPTAVGLARALDDVFPEYGVEPDGLSALLHDQIFDVTGFDLPDSPPTGSVLGVPLDIDDPHFELGWMRKGPDGTYALAWPGESHPHRAGLGQGEKPELMRLDSTTGAVEFQCPWAYGPPISQIALTGGDPVVVWSLGDAGPVRAWRVDAWDDITLLQPPSDSFKAGAAHDGVVLLGKETSAGVQLWTWDISSGESQTVELPDDLPDSYTLFSISAAPEGWLVAVQADYRGSALWLSSDSTWTREEALPATWNPDRVVPVGDGLALIWGLFESDWMMYQGYTGVATWTPAEDWTVWTATDSAGSWRVASVDDAVAMVWSTYDDSDKPWRVATVDLP
ncbi:MAG: hypothetical protein GXP62_17395 [Oligoflexia bacterium]|nr:hypothetical protein [Oligoflexia bacterium]